MDFASLGIRIKTCSACGHVHDAKSSPPTVEAINRQIPIYGSGSLNPGPVVLCYRALSVSCASCGLEYQEVLPLDSKDTYEKIDAEIASIRERLNRDYPENLPPSMGGPKPVGSDDEEWESIRTMPSPGWLDGILTPGRLIAMAFVMALLSIAFFGLAFSLLR